MKRKPFTKRERHRATQNGLGYRPTNNWNGGDLPAPFAEGDVLYLDESVRDGRLYGMRRPGYFVVTYATSIDEGDAWYFRVWDGESDRRSDRLHVAWASRSDFTEDLDWLHGAVLVETDDPQGLAFRELLIAKGWTFDKHRPCPMCGRPLSPSLSTEEKKK